MIISVSPSPSQNKREVYDRHIVLTRCDPKRTNEYPRNHCVWDSLFEFGQRRRDANIVSQQVQRGYEVTPLDQLTQWATTESVFCYFETRLLGQQAQVHQDLIEGGKKYGIN